MKMGYHANVGDTYRFYGTSWIRILWAEVLHTECKRRWRFKSLTPFWAV